MLRLTIVSARIHHSKSTKPECFVTANFEGTEKQTTVVKKQTPVWNETFEWSLEGFVLDSQSHVELEVHGTYNGEVSIFGSNKIHLKELLSVQEQLQTLSDIPLLDPKKKPTMNTLTLKVICTWKEKTGKVNIHEGLRIEQDQWKRDFSDNVQDFQVRVRIIAGRQLYGNNIKPVVKVLVGKKSHHTSVRRGNNPYFNEASTE
ncbi:fer-1-like protein 5 [Pelobates fuscus]|uniref:fer-1-like protein 5 n=1 Tax=Pelobates fuscus TaxID=191477 RepID=UPI002FE4A579